MESFLVLILVVFAVIVFTVLNNKKKADDINEIWPYIRRNPLSEPEQILYYRLLEALPEHIVLCQVQLSRLLGVERSANQIMWMNRINRMSVDFVICDKSFKAIAVIELDDATHEKKERQVADNKKDRALKSAVIRVIRWQARRMPDVRTIRKTIING